MRRIMLAVLAVLPAAGCGLLEPGRNRGTTLPGRPTSGPRPTRPPADDWTYGPGPKTNLPKSVTPTPTPKDSTFNMAKERREVLGGVVEDASGKPAPRVPVEYTAADGSDGPGALLETLTDEKGRFLIRGLEANKSYILTSRATTEGRALAGRIYARTGANNAQQLRLNLVEGLSLPSTPTAPRTGTEPGDTPPRTPTNTSDGTPPNRPYDTFIPPSMGPSSTDAKPSSAPAPVPLSPGRTTGGSDLPPPRRNEDIRDLDGTPAMPNLPPPGSGTGGPAGARPELRTEVPQPFYPPVTNIPGSSNRKPSTPQQAEFLLKDLEGVPREFGASTTKEVILIDWMSTTCEPCSAAIPQLIDLQKRFSPKGLEVIAIVSDNMPFAARVERGKKYASYHKLNYRLFTEPGDTVGTLHERFDVQSYPTLTLIDGKGRILWQGHPSDAKNLEVILNRILN